MPRPPDDDPEFDDLGDARLSAVITELAQLRDRGAPDPRFRSELRTQLVAITPRIVEEVEASTPAADDRREPARPATARGRILGALRAGSVAARHADVRVATRAVRWRRPLAAAASSLVVLGILLGIGVWLSRDALPGDTLYGLKRSSERVQLYFASSDTDRAKDYLEFAQRRAGEVQSLLRQDTASAVGSRPSAAGVSAATARLVEDTLASADSDAEHAMRLLGGLAARRHSAAPLDPIKTWAPPQAQRLWNLAAGAPSTALRDRLTRSVEVVQKLWVRTAALDVTVACSCAGGSGSDSLGPLPCTPCSTSATNPNGTATGSGTATTSAPRTSGAGHAPGSSGGTRVGGTSGARSSGGAAPSSANRAPGGGGAPASSTRAPGLPLPSVSVRPSISIPRLPITTPRLPISIPRLPISTPSLPITSKPVQVGSCHVAVNGGPLHVTVTVCPSAGNR